MILGKKLYNRLSAFGHWSFYIVIRFFGHRGGIALLLPVITVYLLCSRRIHRVIRPYMAHRFPNESRICYWRHSFKNVFSFGKVLVDRAWLGLSTNASSQDDSEGENQLIELVNQGKGVVLVTAHVGNWQTAFAHLGTLPVQTQVLMQYDQQATAKHYFDLHAGGKRPFKIIDTNGPFGGMVEAAAALRRGELVTIMADRYIKGSASTVEFFGDPVRLPDGPYLLAALSGAPVVVILTAKTRFKKHHMKIWDCFYPHYDSRDDRVAMLKGCTTRYIRALENYLDLYPYQWYNFFDFWQQ